MKKQTYEMCITKYENYYNGLSKIKNIIKYEPKNDLEMIFKTYILFEGATNTAEYLNEKEYRIETERGSRKYNSKDITEILTANFQYYKIDKDLRMVAEVLHDKNSRYEKWIDLLIRTVNNVIEG